MQMAALKFLLETAIGKVVFAETLILVFGIMGTVFLLISRNALSNYRINVQERLSDELINLLFSEKQEKIKVWPWQRKIYRQAILIQIHSLAGQERDKMVSH